jgi:hypothetical protein
VPLAWIIPGTPGTDPSDPCQTRNLVDDANYRSEVAHHHALLLGHLRQSDDPFVLLPAFDSEGHNLWESTATR